MAQPRLILAVLALAACADRDPFIAPGGSGGGGGGGGSGGGGARDAGPRLDGGGGGEIRGRICQVTDVRAGAPCTTADGTGLTVEIFETGAQAAVAADGTFTLPAAGAVSTLVTNTDHPVWFGGAMQVIGAGNVTLPVMAADDVASLLLANAIVLEPGRGILVVHVTAGGSPAAGANLSALGGIAPFYDAGDPELFFTDGPTGPLGTAVYFNAPPGGGELDVTLDAITVTVDAFAAGDALSWAFVALSTS